MSQEVISRKQLPIRLPIWQTIVMWLLLEKLDAGDIWYGAYYVLFGLIWITSIVVLFREKQVEIKLIASNNKIN